MNRIKFLVIVGSFIFSMTAAFANPSKGGRISCTLSPSKSSILPFEPVAVVATLQNESNEQVEIEKPGQLFVSVGEVGPGGEIKWRPYHGEHEGTVFPSLPSKIKLESKEAKIGIRFVDYDTSRTHVFARPGNLKLKARFGGFETNVIDITIQAPAGVDAVVYESLQANDKNFLNLLSKGNGNEGLGGENFLRENITARLFTHNFVGSYRYNRKTSEALEDFTSKFYGSTYITYAQFTLARMWIEGVEGTVDYEKSASILNELSRSTDSFLSAQANYYLGMVMQKQGRISEAASFYFKIFESQPDPLFGHLGETALNQISNQPSDLQTEIKKKLKELVKKGSVYNRQVPEGR